MSPIVIVGIFAVVLLVAGLGVALIIHSIKGVKNTLNDTPRRTFMDAISAHHGGIVANSGTASLMHQNYGLRISYTLGKNRHFHITVEPPGRTWPERFIPLNPLDPRMADAEPVPFHNDRAIQLSHETRHNRLGKTLHINREIQTGDADFDQAVYIDTEADESLVLRTLQDTRARHAARALLDAGFGVTLLNRQGPVRLTHGSPEHLDPSQPAFRAYLDHAITLVNALPPLRDQGQAPKSAIPALILVAAGVLTFANLLVVVATEDMWPLLTHQLHVMLLGLTGALTCFALPISVWLFKGNSSAFSKVTLTAIFFPIVVFLGLEATARPLNVWLDHSKPEVVQGTMKRTFYTTNSKNNTRTYHFEIDLVYDGEHITEDYVDRMSLYATSKGTPLDITVRKGALGHPWIEAIEARPEKLPEALRPKKRRKTRRRKGKR